MESDAAAQYREYLGLEKSHTDVENVPADEVVTLEVEPEVEPDADGVSADVDEDPVPAPEVATSDDED